MSNSGQDTVNTLLEQNKLEELSHLTYIINNIKINLHFLLFLSWI